MSEFTKALRDALAEAIRAFTEHGFDRSDRLDEWVRRLRFLALRAQSSREKIEESTSRSLEQQFKRSIAYANAHKKNPGVSRFTIDRIQPSLRAELTRRIHASAQLIEQNREHAVEMTLQRFSGWASSVPAGGSRVVNQREVRHEISKALAQLPFKERRVLIDQGHKLMSSIDAVIAQQTDAIAGVWHSHWNRPGYQYREAHKERDKKVYVIRNNWAMEKGLIKRDVDYLDEISQPGEEPYCSCYVVYLHNLRDLPTDMLSDKGREELEKASKATRGMQE